ncbi:hypothetical protein JOM56_002572 [Amanita muscaria]
MFPVRELETSLTKPYVLGDEKIDFDGPVSTHVIPTFPRYAVPYQSTVPLSDKEGLRLGMEDMLKIYRIRHELYDSGVTPVPFEVAFVKVKEAGLASTWMLDLLQLRKHLQKMKQTEVQMRPLSCLKDLNNGMSMRIRLVTSPRQSPWATSEAATSVFPGNVSDLNSGSSLNLVEELTR